jgi:uncharacterized protein
MVTPRAKPEPFAPAWWLSGPHCQTLWGRVARWTALPSGELRRLITPDNDFVDVFQVPTTGKAPHLIVLHGLEGGLNSHYARGILARAAAIGWGAELLLFRGCGPEPNRAPRFYHSGDTGDLALVVQTIAAAYPHSPLFLVGYSLGGNVLLKWLGEQGLSLVPQVRAAAAVSVPYDLEAGARYINRGFSRVYERHFLRTLKAKAAAKLVRFPGLFDASALASADTIVAFDQAVTAPVHGFANAQAYYARSSCLQFLARVRVPTLLLSAFDDPFLPPDVLTVVGDHGQMNAALHVEFPGTGGHVGFVGGSTPGRPVYWAEQRIVTFLTQHLSAEELGSPV